MTTNMFIIPIENSRLRNDNNGNTTQGISLIVIKLSEINGDLPFVHCARCVVVVLSFRNLSNSGCQSTTELSK